MGLNGTIHAKGGRTVTEACRAAVAGMPHQTARLGSVVTTPGGDLPAKWVLHAVAPHTPEDAAVLRPTYDAVLAAAVACG